MWTKAKVDEALKGYINDKARALHLAIEIRELERRVDTAVKMLTEDEASVKAQVITGMPHGTKISNPTEETAMKLAAGWLPEDIKEMQEDLKGMKMEYEAAKKRVDYVEAWTKALTEREYWILLHQYIQQEFWRDILSDYDKVFGGYATKETLKRLRAKAFKQIYATAGVKN